MFNLYYQDGLGGWTYIIQLSSQQACENQAAADLKSSYQIECLVNSLVVSVISC